MHPWIWLNEPQRSAAVQALSALTGVPVAIGAFLYAARAYSANAHRLDLPSVIYRWKSESTKTRWQDQRRNVSPPWRRNIGTTSKGRRKRIRYVRVFNLPGGQPMHSDTAIVAKGIHQPRQMQRRAVSPLVEVPRKSGHSAPLIHHVSSCLRASWAANSASSSLTWSRASRQ